MKKTNSDVREFETLLIKAKQDLEVAETLLREMVKSGKDSMHDNCGYHLAQASEKAMKAYLCVNDITYSKDGKTGHRLDILIEHILDRNLMFDEKYDAIADLDVYNSKSRYDCVFESERLDLNKYYFIVLELVSSLGSALLRARAKRA
jgi:HEPN domain-containing protein